MRNKRLVQAGLVLGLGALSLTACGGKDAGKETVTETVLETTVEAADSETVNSTLEDVVATELEVESGTGGVDDSYGGFGGDEDFSYGGEDTEDVGNADVGNAGDSVTDPFDVNYSVFKAPVEVGSDEEKMVETYAYIYDKDGEFYDVYTVNGPFRFQYDKDLPMHGCVVIVNTGITTMSYPGIIADVREVRDVAVDEVLVDGMSLDDLFKVESVTDTDAVKETTVHDPENFKVEEAVVDVDYTVYPDVAYNADNTEAVYYCEVADVSEDAGDGIVTYTVYTANGMKEAQLDKNSDVYVDAAIGDYITITSSGAETRSYPGGLMDIKSVVVSVDEVIAEITARKAAK